MNLHQWVSGAIARVNPFVPVTLRHPNGITKNADFTRTSTYATSTIQAQVQALTSGELSQVDGLNIEGEKLSIYTNGLLEGVSRVDNTGGDLITLPDGSVWLVVLVDENWSRTAGWTKAAMVRQSS